MFYDVRIDAFLSIEKFLESLYFIEDTQLINS